MHNNNIKNILKNTGHSINMFNKDKLQSGWCVEMNNGIRSLVVKKCDFHDSKNEIVGSIFNDYSGLDKENCMIMVVFFKKDDEVFTDDDGVLFDYIDQFCDDNLDSKWENGRIMRIYPTNLDINCIENYYKDKISLACSKVAYFER